jgi:ArsR family transcriptional regulator
MNFLGVEARLRHDPQGDLQPYGVQSDSPYRDLVDDSVVVEQLRALGDPVRLAIVRELRGGTRCACELARVAAVSSPLLSHHLKVLRAAGLVTGVKRGRWIDYTLDVGAMDATAEALHRLASDDEPDGDAP